MGCLKVLDAFKASFDGDLSDLIYQVSLTMQGGGGEGLFLTIPSNPNYFMILWV